MIPRYDRYLYTVLSIEDDEQGQLDDDAREGRSSTPRAGRVVISSTPMIVHGRARTGDDFGSLRPNGIAFARADAPDASGSGEPPFCILSSAPGVRDG